MVGGQVQERAVLLGLVVYFWRGHAQGPIDVWDRLLAWRVSQDGEVIGIDGGVHFKDPFPAVVGMHGAHEYGRCLWVVVNRRTGGFGHDPRTARGVRGYAFGLDNGFDCIDGSLLDILVEGPDVHREIGKLGYDAGVGSTVEIATGDGTALLAVDLSGDDHLQA